MSKSKLFPFMPTALKNLFSKPATTAYPFEPATYPERMRGHVEIEIQKCISCGLCARSCPPTALTVDRAAGTWTINRFDCVQCGSCVNVCPKKCLHIVPGYATPGPQKKSETFTRPTPPSKADGKVGLQTGGHPVNDHDKCVYCTLCARKCPQGAITVDRAAKTWTLDKEACVSCGLCASSCPKKCLTMKED